MMIGCLTLCLIMDEIVVNKERSQLVESVARRTLVIYFLKRTIVTDMIKVGIRFDIS